MKRVAGLLGIALLTVAVAATGYAQDKKEAAPKAQTAMGAVTAVTATSLTAKGKDAEWTFTIDKDTKVTARGASTKTAEMKKENKGTSITDVVHVGDQVRVSYHDMGATKHAASVTVTTPAPTKKK
jgi:hypothetical protein